MVPEDKPLPLPLNRQWLIADPLRRASDVIEPDFGPNLQGSVADLASRASDTGRGSHIGTRGPGLGTVVNVSLAR
jgi:hypothetical protein